MSIERYRTFVVAAQSKTFFEAADKLYIMPATVSKHIAALEKELGVVLFTRTPQGVVLTEEGRKKLPYVRQLVKAYDTLTGNADTPEKSQSVTVLTSPPPSRFGVEKIVRGFSEYRPDIKLNVREIRGATNALIGGEGDLGFLGDGHLDSNQLRWLVVQYAELGVVLPADHALAGRQSISLRELKDDRFIFPNPITGVLPRYMDLCRQCGFTPNVSCYTYREDSVLFYVSCGEGVSFMTKEMFDRFNFENVAFVSLDEEFYVTGVLARSRNSVLSPEASVFWDYVKKNFSIKIT